MIHSIELFGPVPFSPPGSGGDYELHFGHDLSIGYLGHDSSTVELYFHETLTFLVNTAEAAVGLIA